MDTRCRIEMFGGLRVLQGDQVHTRFRTHKAGLLAYLAITMPQVQSRDRLLDLFWPDMEPEAGRDNLSTALSQLRRQLEPVGIPTGSLLVADRQQVKLNPQAVSTDVADFDRIIAQAWQAEDKLAQADLLEKAVQLYRGELLPGCYENWATPEQTRCQTQYHEALLRLTRLWEEAGRYADALATAQRATAGDPYNEAGYQAQIRLLVRLRKPSVALQTYENMERLFQSELGARPSPATRQMAEMIRQDPRAALLMRAEAAVGRSSSVTRTVEAATIPIAPVSAVSTAPPAPALPLQLTRFFGREQDREQVARLLRTPGVRLVSILGPGGAGKTRLALEVAGQVAAAFADRVWFVSLADIPDVSLIAPMLAQALRLPPNAAADPLDRMAGFLADAPCLLVLDNLEHLLRLPPDAGKSDNAAVSTCAGLVCLATSRQPLHLGGEHEFPLPPLALPTHSGACAPESLLSNESVALYVDRARASRPDFMLTAQNASDVAALCRRLEGMPLAIEMAAAWVRTLPPHKMLERMEQQLDLLVSRRHDLPPRHQSLRATIEWSYDLLSPDLRRMFAQLSIFHGGWTLEAAEAVCGSDAMHALIALQEQSMIVVAEEEEETRYRMLEPLREFAQRKLTESGHADALLADHAAYFVQRAEQAHRQFDGPHQAQALNWFLTEIENVRAALNWIRAHTGDPISPKIGPPPGRSPAEISDCGLAGASPATLEQELKLALALHRFLDRAGRYQETSEMLLKTFERTASLGATLERSQAAQSLGMLHWYRGDYTRAHEWHAAALSLSQELGDKVQIGSALNGLANTTYYQGNFALARDYYEQALAVAREIDNKRMIAVTLNNLGLAASYSGDYAHAGPYFTESLALRRQLDDRRMELAVQHNIAEMYMRQGEHARADAILTQVLHDAREGDEKRLLSYAQHVLAELRIAQGRYPEAAQALAESLLRILLRHFFGRSPTSV